MNFNFSLCVYSHLYNFLLAELAFTARAFPNGAVDKFFVSGILVIKGAIKSAMTMIPNEVDFVPRPHQNAFLTDHETAVTHREQDLFKGLAGAASALIDELRRKLALRDFITIRLLRRLPEVSKYDIGTVRVQRALCFILQHCKYCACCFVFYIATSKYMHKKLCPNFADFLLADKFSFFTFVLSSRNYY